MISIFTGLLAFLLVEGIYLQTIYNLEAGFLPAIAAGIVVSFITHIYLSRKDAERDAPPPVTYRVPAPVAIAHVKRVLKTYRCGNSRWFINYEDKQTGEIQATIHLVDDGYEEVRWLVSSGRIDKHINLQIWLLARPKMTTEVHMNWFVDAELTRTDCNLVIDDTTALIHEALATAESNRENCKQFTA